MEMKDLSSEKLTVKIISAILICSMILVLWPSFPTCAMPEVSSECWVLMDAQTGQVLAESGMNKRMYPASITKIMTLLIACEKANPDTVVTMSEYAAVTSVPRDASHIALTAGEEVRMEDLMYAAMLASANDACNGIAESIAGSIDAFAAMMTARAKEIGAVNTNFVNANGLFDENHYATAYDMALITREAIKNTYFSTIFSTVRYELAPDNKRTEVYPVATGMDLLKPTNPLYYEGILGGKTGYLSEAGYTGVAVAERNGIKLIAVTMNAATAEARFADLAAVLDYGFNNFSKHFITSAIFPAQTVNVVENNNIVAWVTAYTDDSVYYLLHNDVQESSVRIQSDIPEIYSQYNILPSLTLSLPDTETLMYTGIGKVYLKFNTQQLENPAPYKTADDTQPTVTTDVTKNTGIPGWLKAVLIILAVIFLAAGTIIAMFVVSNAKRKRRDRMRRLRRQAMYEESRSDMILREDEKNKQVEHRLRH